MNKKEMMVSMILCALGASGFASSGSAAQSVPEYYFDKTIVTATRDLEEIKRVPASVSVIESKEIEKKNATTVTDAISKMLGVYVERPKGLADTANSIEMRGFGESDILVLYDGMPMNTAYDGGVNWTAIPLANIERIEVVRGAASSLYGGRAVGGVINIITKEPSNELKASGALVGGSNSTWRKSLYLSQQPNEKIGYRIGFEQRSTAGFENKVASSTSSGSAQPNGTIGTGLIVSQKIDGKPRYIIGSPGRGAGKSSTYNAEIMYNFDKEKKLTYSYMHDKFRYWTTDPRTNIFDSAGNPLFAGSVQLPNGKWYNFSESAFTDYYGRRDTDVHSLRYRDEGNKLTFNIGVSDIKDSGYSTGSFFDGSKPGNDTSYPSKSYKVDLQKVWSNVGRHTIVAGLNAQKDEMTRTGKKLSAWHDWDSVISTNTVIGGKNSSFATFLQDKYEWSDRLSMYAGIRFDYYKKYDGSFHDYTNNTFTKYDEASFTQWSPKLAFEYAADDKTNYYVSYGHSFNAPSLYKLYRTDSSYIGNPDLIPEKSDSFELGVKKQLGSKTNLHFAVYKSFTKDLIVAETVPGLDKKWYVNKDKATRIGFETELSHKFDDKWEGYLNYQWQNVSKDGETIYSYPKHILHTGVGYTAGKWSGNLDVGYVSNRNDPGDLSNVYLSYDGFVTLNTGVTYEINKNMRATFTINNLLDRDYYQWYKADGRTFYLGLNFDL